MGGSFKKLAFFPNTEETRKRVFVDKEGNRFVKWTLETRIRKVNKDGFWFTILLMENCEDTFENYKRPEVHKANNERLLGTAYMHLLQYTYNTDYNTIDYKQVDELERMGLPTVIKATDGET